MADREWTDEQKRYNGPDGGGDLADTAQKAAKNIEPHKSENRTTTSTEGKVETTTKEK